jgi:peptidoglycan/xylan/chitin deacetylase (PgdA/CDA1 family)
MATLTADQLRSQMTQLETALTNILGYFPYYMRPPFLSVNAGALATLRELEYNVVIGDLNTEDWSYQSAAGIEVAKQKLVTGLDAGGTIIEAHDQEEWTHGVLIDFMIATIVQRGLTSIVPYLSSFTIN